MRSLRHPPISEFCPDAFSINFAKTCISACNDWCYSSCLDDHTFSVFCGVILGSACRQAVQRPASTLSSGLDRHQSFRICNRFCNRVPAVDTGTPHLGSCWRRPKATRPGCTRPITGLHCNPPPVANENEERFAMVRLARRQSCRLSNLTLRLGDNSANEQSIKLITLG